MTGRRRLIRLLGVAIVSWAVLTAAFLWIASQYPQAPLGDFDERVSHATAEQREAAPALRALLFGITQVGRFEVMLVLVPLVALLLFLKGKRAWAVVCVLCGLGVGLSNGTLKHHYNRHRPVETRDPGVDEENESFPSGHASGSMGIIGLMGFLAAKSTTNRKKRVSIIVGFVLLIVAIGFSRIFLSAHYFSDVVAGYLLGLGWLVLGLTTLALLPPPSEKRRPPVPEASSGTGDASPPLAVS